MIRLNLANNKLDGAVPKELGLCSSMSCLNLGENRLEGEIPKEFGLLHRLVSNRKRLNSNVM